MTIDPEHFAPSDSEARDEGNTRASLDRLLSHLEAQGEVYAGAGEDVARIRAAVAKSVEAAPVEPVDPK